MKETLRLLLRRGADANASMKPMPVLFFAVKVADVDMVRSLLMQGSSTCARLVSECYLEIGWWKCCCDVHYSLALIQCVVH